MGKEEKEEEVQIPSCFSLVSCFYFLIIAEVSIKELLLCSRFSGITPSKQKLVQGIKNIVFSIILLC